MDDLKIVKNSKRGFIEFFSFNISEKCRCQIIFQSEKELLFSGKQPKMLELKELNLNILRYLKTVKLV